MKIPTLLALVLCIGSSAFAQSPATLGAIGYTAPGFPTSVAPGQVVTLFFMACRHSLTASCDPRKLQVYRCLIHLLDYPCTSHNSP